MSKSTYMKGIKVDGLLISQEFLDKASNWLKNISEKTTNTGNPQVQYQINFIDEIKSKTTSIEALTEIFNLAKARFYKLEIQVEANEYSKNTLAIDSEGRISYDSYVEDEKLQIIDRSFKSLVSELDRLPFQGAFRKLNYILTSVLSVMAILFITASFFSYKEVSNKESNLISIENFEPISESQSMQLYVNAIKSNNTNEKLDAILKSKFVSYQKITKKETDASKKIAIKSFVIGLVSILFWIILNLVEKHLFPLYAIDVGRFKRINSTKLYVRNILFGAITIGILVNIISSFIGV